MTRFLKFVFRVLKNFCRADTSHPCDICGGDCGQCGGPVHLNLTEAERQRRRNAADYVVTREGEAIKTTARVELRAKLPRQ